MSSVVGQTVDGALTVLWPKTEEALRELETPLRMPGQRTRATHSDGRQGLFLSAANFPSASDKQTTCGTCNQHLTIFLAYRSQPQREILGETLRAHRTFHLPAPSL